MADRRATTSRRRFLAVSAMAAAGPFVSGFVRVRSAPRIEVLETTVISPDAQHYHGWPTVTRLPAGQLLLVCSGGREAHVCPFGRVDLFVSNDDGKSWSWPRTLLDSNVDDRDAGILRTANGTLLVTTFTSLAYEPILKAAETDGTWDAEKLRRWQAAHRRMNPGRHGSDLGQWMIRSTDGGRTWSPRYPSVVNSPHGPIQLGDGRLLYAGKELWTGQRRTGVCESRDDGLTWQWLAEIPARPLATRSSSITSCTPSNARTGAWSCTSAITTRPTRARRCNANPPTEAARGACRIPSGCGAFRRTCCASGTRRGAC
jgi:hypothetical protein